MPIYGDNALKLVTSSHRSEQTNTLHAYDSTAVRAIALETRQLAEALYGTVDSLNSVNDLRSEEHAGTVARLTVQNMCIRHNKRCLLAYHAHRLDRLQDAYWNTGTALGHLLQGSGEVRSKISPQEADFLRAYSSMLATYKEPFLDVFDPFATRITQPPKDLYCNVRVLKDCGAIQVESGIVDFRRDMRFKVVRSDVERLIVQGYLEVVP